MELVLARAQVEMSHLQRAQSMLPPPLWAPIVTFA
jgi:hypothetical protein